MGLFSGLQRVGKGMGMRNCVKVYEDAKRKRPGKPERDYFKMVVLTKKPFDMAQDEIVEILMKGCDSIEDLADIICDMSMIERQMEINQRQTMMGQNQELKRRNIVFFEQFWRG